MAVHEFLLSSKCPDVLEYKTTAKSSKMVICAQTNQNKGNLL